MTLTFELQSMPFFLFKKRRAPEITQESFRHTLKNVCCSRWLKVNLMQPTFDSHISQRIYQWGKGQRMSLDMSNKCDLMQKTEKTHCTHLQNQLLLTMIRIFGSSGTTEGCSYPTPSHKRGKAALTWSLAPCNAWISRWSSEKKSKPVWIRVHHTLCNFSYGGVNGGYHAFLQSQLSSPPSSASCFISSGPGTGSRSTAGRRQRSDWLTPLLSMSSPIGRHWLVFSDS